MADKIYRAWINQPSTLQPTLQPLHHMHGKRCIAVEDRPGNVRLYVRLYFTEGPVHSMDAKPLWISKVKLSSVEN